MPYGDERAGREDTERESDAQIHGSQRIRRRGRTRRRIHDREPAADLGRDDLGFIAPVGLETARDDRLGELLRRVRRGLPDGEADEVGAFDHLRGHRARRLPIIERLGVREQARITRGQRHQPRRGEARGPAAGAALAQRIIGVVQPAVWPHLRSAGAQRFSHDLRRRLDAQQRLRGIQRRLTCGDGGGGRDERRDQSQKRQAGGPEDPEAAPGRRHSAPGDAATGCPAISRSSSTVSQWSLVSLEYVKPSATSRPPFDRKSNVLHCGNAGAIT